MEFIIEDDKYLLPTGRLDCRRKTKKEFTNYKTSKKILFI